MKGGEGHDHLQRRAPRREQLCHRVAQQRAAHVHRRRPQQVLDQLLALRGGEERQHGRACMWSIVNIVVRRGEIVDLGRRVVWLGGHGLSVGFEVTGASSRFERAAPSLQMQADELLVASFCALANTATLTMLAGSGLVAHSDSRHLPAARLHGQTRRCGEFGGGGPWRLWREGGPPWRHTQDGRADHPRGSHAIQPLGPCWRAGEERAAEQLGDELRLVARREAADELGNLVAAAIAVHAQLVLQLRLASAALLELLQQDLRGAKMRRGR